MLPWGKTRNKRKSPKISENIGRIGILCLKPHQIQPVSPDVIGQKEWEHVANFNQQFSVNHWVIHSSERRNRKDSVKPAGFQEDWETPACPCASGTSPSISSLNLSLVLSHVWATLVRKRGHWPWVRKKWAVPFEPRGPAVQKHEESLLEAVWPRETESIPEMPGVVTGHQSSIRRTHSQEGL